jgi:hypothetical protein
MNDHLLEHRVLITGQHFKHSSKGLGKGNGMSLGIAMLVVRQIKG